MVQDPSKVTEVKVAFKTPKDTTTDVELTVHVQLCKTMARTRFYSDDESSQPQVDTKVETWKFKGSNLPWNDQVMTPNLKSLFDAWKAMTGWCVSF